MAASLRDFGGALAEADVLVMTRAPAAEFPERDRELLAAQDARLVSFDLEPTYPALPFAGKAAAAAAAEELLGSGGALLAWLDPDTLVLAEPEGLALADETSLGCRPVHHRNIGLPRSDPLDEFWRIIFERCNVPQDRVTAVITNVGERIHSYLNAGHFVVRSGRGLMAAWRDAVVDLSGDRRVASLLEADGRRAVFLHQAVFTGVLLGALEPEETVDLGHRYNYPLHLHEETPAELRPTRLADLITVRTEGLLTEPSWRDRLPLLAPLAHWLQPRIAPIQQA
jgi:hypothetical protein